MTSPHRSADAPVSRSFARAAACAALALAAGVRSLGAQQAPGVPAGVPAGSSATPAGGSGTPRVEHAAAAFRAGRYAEAKAELEGVVAGDPRNAEALYYLGRVALAARDVDGAVQRLGAAVRLADADARYHTWLGRAYGEQARRANLFRQPGLASAARAQLERAVALAPDDLEARKALSEFYAVAPSAAGGGKAKAREQAAEIKRRNAYEGALQTAWVLADGNDPAGAERELLEARRAFPDSIGPARALADLYVTRLSRPADGYRLLDSLAHRRPDDMPTQYSLGRAGAVWGQQLDVAQRALTAYLAHTPHDGEPTLAAAHYRLGTVHAQRGDTAAARAAYQAALRLDPSLAAARTALDALR